MKPEKYTRSNSFSYYEDPSSELGSFNFFNEVTVMPKNFIHNCNLALVPTIGQLTHYGLKLNEARIIVKRIKNSKKRF